MGVITPEVGPCPLRETLICEKILTTFNKKISPERLNLFHENHLWARENKSNFIRKFLSFFFFKQTYWFNHSFTYVLL